MSQPKKVAILGGGAAALTVAYELTNVADWKDRYESITVYQMGWRLGGKGASGRGLYGRIEEHGLHIWMGWYANAFAMMRAVYEELGRPKDAPLARWDGAFKRHSLINLGEQVDGKWLNWPLNFPTTDDTPGQGRENPTVWDMVHETLSALHRLLAGTLFTEPPPQRQPGLCGLLRWLGQEARHLVHLGEDAVDIVVAELLLRESRDRAHAARQGGDAAHSERDPIAHLMHGIRDRLIAHLEHRIDGDTEARRLFTIVDIGLSCVTGVLSASQALGPHALDAFDEIDFRDFLRRHGARPSSVTSSLTKAFYDLLFAYRDGNPDDEQCAAGVSLRFIYRMCLDYEGAIFWKMQAGMGDTIFTPLHQVLERRGVKFRFFHRVDRLELSPDQRSVARIHIGRQATLVGGDTYRPYVDINDLPCWPSEPLYDQLVEGVELKAQGINLESFWTPWREHETPIVLEQGRDFDAVVFGISIGSIPFVAAELVAASPRWQDTVQAVETVCTQAAQVWVQLDIQELGWTMGSAVTDAYPEPMDTWADMTHLLPRESWPAHLQPRNLTYFCAPLKGGIPPLSDTQAPARAEAEVKMDTIDWLSKYATIMWPKAGDPASPGRGFDWNLLVDPQQRQGPACFDSQFWRANVDPSERYVLSVPRSTAKRLRASAPDFDNLWVTGDWTYNGVNAGCVEAAVMSGRLTASAMSGRPTLQEIVGYDMP